MWYGYSIIPTLTPLLYCLWTDFSFPILEFISLFLIRCYYYSQVLNVFVALISFITNSRSWPPPVSFGCFSLKVPLYVFFSKVTKDKPITYILLYSIILLLLVVKSLVLLSFNFLYHHWFTETIDLLFLIFLNCLRSHVNILCVRLRLRTRFV